MIQIDGVLPVWRVNAIRRPLGDHAGSESGPRGRAAPASAPPAGERRRDGHDRIGRSNGPVARASTTRRPLRERRVVVAAPRSPGGGARTSGRQRLDEDLARRGPPARRRCRGKGQPVALRVPCRIDELLVAEAGRVPPAPLTRSWPPWRAATLTASAASPAGGAGYRHDRCGTDRRRAGAAAAVRRRPSLHPLMIAGHPAARAGYGVWPQRPEQSAPRALSDSNAPTRPSHCRGSRSARGPATAAGAVMVGSPLVAPATNNAPAGRCMTNARAPTRRRRDIAAAPSTWCRPGSSTASSRAGLQGIQWQQRDPGPAAPGRWRVPGRRTQRGRAHRRRSTIFDAARISVKVAMRSGCSTTPMRS